MPLPYPQGNEAWICLVDEEGNERSDWVLFVNNKAHWNKNQLRLADDDGFEFQSPIVGYLVRGLLDVSATLDRHVGFVDVEIEFPHLVIGDW